MTLDALRDLFAARLTVSGLRLEHMSDPNAPLPHSVWLRGGIGGDELIGAGETETAAGQEALTTLREDFGW